MRYTEVRLDVIDQTVCVGYVYDEPGSFWWNPEIPDSITVQEVLLHDVDILLVLDYSVIRHIEAVVYETAKESA